MAERRTDRLLDPSRSHGLPSFLADDPGVDSGLMIAHYTQAAMVSESKRLAVPASVDSIPTSAMQEDHVSMGWSAARKLRCVAGRTLGRILAVELLAAARAIELAGAAGGRPGQRGGPSTVVRCPRAGGRAPTASPPPELAGRGRLVTDRCRRRRRTGRRAGSD